MDAAREDRLERLFEEAAALPPARRAAMLDEACAGEPELRVMLEALLARADAAYDFVARVAEPVIARAAGFVWDATPAGEEDDADPLTGRQLAHFRILEPLGGGGMGRVYKALDLRLDRTVALKFLPPHLGTDQEAIRRFNREAKAASALDHPNIGTVHEIGETGTGRLFIAMAHYEGETLKQKIARGPLPIRDALDYVAQLGAGLRHAHDAGIVHRDIKPANVLVTALGQVKIVDFGLAKMAGTDLTREGTTVGTIGYMSPEQTRGAGLDPRTDLWSVGVVLYEMLTGRRPFQGDGDQVLIHAIRHDAPKPLRDLRPELPAGVAALVDRCLEKDATHRYQHADELLADLRSVHEGGAPARRRAGPRRVMFYGSAAVLLLLLALRTDALLRRPDDRLHSLAVLPVTDFTADTARDYFAEGMTDLLINQLSRLSGLRRVISRTSVMRYRGTQKSSREIGRELGVDVLVEASVQREGGRIRITVNLTEADAGRVLWSHDFDRPMRDVLTLQREVAQAVARELRVQMTPQETARLANPAHEVNPEAFELYLRAARWPEQEHLPKMAYLEQAIAKDSAFALAYAMVAVPYIMNARVRDKGKAEWAIAKALALDPANSEAYAARGLLRMVHDWDWPAAEAAFRKAIELDPHNSLAHHELGQLLMRVGQCDEAIAKERRAIFLNPASAQFQSGLAEVLQNCRRYDEAIREFGKVPALDASLNTFWALGETYFHQGQYEKALEEYGKTPRVPGWLHAALGSRREAVQQIGELQAAGARGEGRRHGFSSWDWDLARLYMSLGKHEEAITWLERAYEQHSVMLMYLGVQPDFDPLRGKPRFRTLMTKVGLAN